MIRLCTTMLNEAETLPRLAEGCKNIIDEWLIVDDVATTDNSAEVAEQAFSYAPGKVIRPERGFSDLVEKRNFALQQAREMGELSDYLLILNADEPPELLSPLPVLDQPIYALVVRDGPLETLSAHLVRADYPCEWRDPVHEYLFHEGDRIYVLSHIRVHRYGSTATRDERIKQMEVLQARFAETHNPRDLYYIAQTFWVLQEIERAFFCSMMLANMEARPEERFIALMNAAIMIEGVDTETCIYLLKRAQLFRPSRPESYYHLARINNNMGRYAQARRWAEKGITLPRCLDGFFVMRWVEEEGLKQEVERARKKGN